MLEKITVVDRIEVIENGCVQVRTKTAILENGEQITSTYHRNVITPGDDFSTEDTRVQAICAAVHTKAVISAYKAKIAEQAAIAQSA